MKIQMVAPTPFFADRGCHVRILGEARALMSLNHEITINTYHNGNNPEGLKIKRIPNIPWYKKLEAGPSYHMLYLDQLLFLYGLRENFRSRPDVIHAHLHEGVFIGKFIKLLARSKAPLVFDAQGSLSGEMIAHGFNSEKSIKNKLFFTLEGFINNMAERIIVSSTNMAEIFTRTFNVDEGMIRIVPDGVDTKVFTGQIPTEDLRKELGIPEKNKIVIYVGLLNEYQGIDYLLKAAKNVLSEFSDVTFLIVGFPNVEKYEAIATQLKINDHVIFTGKIPYKEIPAYLSLADIAVSPKIIESGEANLKLLEYISSRLPVVTFDYSVNRDILGDLGAYAQPKDAFDFSRGVLSLLSSEKRALKTGERLRKKAIDQFSWESIAKEIISIYEEIINN